MKINISKPPRDVQRQIKINAQRVWHKKFAWLPTSVDETESTHSYVCFEYYWRRGEYAPTVPGSRRRLRFAAYSEKEYFKKKLNGDFERGNLGGETGSDTVMSAPTQAVGRALRTKPSISVSADSNTGINHK